MVATKLSWELLSYVFSPGTHQPAIDFLFFFLVSVQIQDMVGVPPAQWRPSDPVPGCLGMGGTGKCLASKSTIFIEPAVHWSCSQEKKIFILEKSKPLSTITSCKSFGQVNSFPHETNMKGGGQNPWARSTVLGKCLAGEGLHSLLPAPNMQLVKHHLKSNMLGSSMDTG